MISEDLKGAVILAVDDNLTNLQILLDYLTEAGFKIIVAEDGEEASERADFVCPDLILLDVMMPGIDGFETCRRLKENPKTADIPIIFITALSETTNKIMGFEAGGADYIAKPFHQEEVLARIAAHLTIRRQQKALEEALAKVKLLSGFLPICCNCKKIRNDTGYWEQIEVYIREHSEAVFSHGICPECMYKLYPEYVK